MLINQSVEEIKHSIKVTNHYVKTFKYFDGTINRLVETINHSVMSFNHFEEAINYSEEGINHSEEAIKYNLLYFNVLQTNLHLFLLSIIAHELLFKKKATLSNGFLNLFCPVDFRMRYLFRVCTNHDIKFSSFPIVF